MSKWQYVHLHLKDELPQIGSGHRWAWVRVEYKWTYVWDETSKCQRKLRTKKFMELKTDYQPKEKKKCRSSQRINSKEPSLQEQRS